MTSEEVKMKYGEFIREDFLTLSDNEQAEFEKSIGYKIDVDRVVYLPVHEFEICEAETLSELQRKVNNLYHRFSYNKTFQVVQMNSYVSTDNTLGGKKSFHVCSITYKYDKRLISDYKLNRILFVDQRFDPLDQFH